MGKHATQVIRRDKDRDSISQGCRQPNLDQGTQVHAGKQGQEAHKLEVKLGSTVSFRTAWTT